MLAIYDNQEHGAVSIRFDADSIRPDPFPATDARPGVPRSTAGTFSVSLVTAPESGQDVAVVSVRGEIDLGTAPMVREALLPVLERDSRAVVVDLSEVPFMDSTGVHLLLDTHQRLEPQNRRLAIACREDSQVYRLLAMVGLLDTLGVHRSRESAVIGADGHTNPSPAAPRAHRKAENPSSTAHSAEGSSLPPPPASGGAPSYGRPARSLATNDNPALAPESSGRLTSSVRRQR